MMEVEIKRQGAEIEQVGGKASSSKLSRSLSPISMYLESSMLAYDELSVPGIVCVAMGGGTEAEVGDVRMSG